MLPAHITVCPQFVTKRNSADGIFFLPHTPRCRLVVGERSNGVGYLRAISNKFKQPSGRGSDEYAGSSFAGSETATVPVMRRGIYFQFGGENAIAVVTDGEFATDRLSMKMRWCGTTSVFWEAMPLNRKRVGTEAVVFQGSWFWRKGWWVFYETVVP